MSTSTVFGIRHTADLEAGDSDWLIDSVGLVNEEAAKTGEAFLFDTVDVAQRILNGHKCWDMFGWIVPIDRLPEVEPLWAAGADEAIDQYYAFAGFDEGLGTPVVTIDREAEE